MKLSDQVIGLEEAKRLKGLGVSQVSIFTHVNFPETVYRKENQAIIYTQSLPNYHEQGETYSAFTVAELGEMFPTDLLPDSGHHYAWFHRYCWKGHSVGYSQVGGHDHIETVWYTTEVAARAALLIKAMEDGILSVEYINRRLLLIDLSNE